MDPNYGRKAKETIDRVLELEPSGTLRREEAAPAAPNRKLLYRNRTVSFWRDGQRVTERRPVVIGVLTPSLRTRDRHLEARERALGKAQARAAILFLIKETGAPSPLAPRARRRRAKW